MLADSEQWQTAGMCMVSVPHGAMCTLIRACGTRRVAPTKHCPLSTQSAAGKLDFTAEAQVHLGWMDGWMNGVRRVSADSGSFWALYLAPELVHVAGQLVAGAGGLAARRMRRVGRLPHAPHILLHLRRRRVAAGRQACGDAAQARASLRSARASGSRALACMLYTVEHASIMPHALQRLHQCCIAASRLSRSGLVQARAQVCNVALAHSYFPRLLACTEIAEFSC